MCGVAAGMRGSQSWQRDSEQIKRAFQIIQRVDSKGPCVKAASLLTKWFIKERERLFTCKRMFFRPGASVHIDHSALISLFPSLHHARPMFARPHGGHRHRCVRKRSRHVNIGSMWRRMEGECSASPAPSSQDLNNSGNPNTHFMQIASTRLQAEGSPLFSPPPAEEGRKQKPDPNPLPGNLVHCSSSVCEPRSQLPWALHCREIGHRKMLLTWYLQQQMEEGERP